MSLMADPYPLSLLKIEPNVRFGSLADVEALRPGRPLIAKSGLLLLHNIDCNLAHRP